GSHVRPVDVAACLVDDDGVSPLVEPGDHRPNTAAVHRHRPPYLLAGIDYQQRGHRRLLSASASRPPENDGTASTSAWTFRPACMTAPSGRTMAAVARPCLSQRPSTLSSATDTTNAPRLSSC